MSSLPPRGYEFSQEQNALIGTLATKMRGVGFILVLVSLVNFLFALLVIAAINRAQLPQNYVDTVLEKVSEASKTDVRAQLSNLPPERHLWSMVLGSAINGLLYLLIGSWTRTASRSFQKVVETKGGDIGHVMDGLSALNKMYSLIYSLIVIGLLVFLAAVGLFIYGQLSR